MLHSEGTIVMRILREIVLVSWVAIFVTGCESTGTDNRQPSPSVSAPIMDESVPSAARNACLGAVSRQTANPDVALGDMIYSEANSQITVTVGPGRAPWRCLVSNQGVVQQVMSLTDEGAL